MRAILALALIALTGCESTTDVSVRVTVPTGVDAASYEVFVHEGACPADAAEALARTDAASAQRWREGETPTALGRLESGPHAVTVIVRDAACAIVAFGCATFDGGDAIEVTAAPAAGPECEESVGCERGLCGGPPVMMRDAGPDADAGELVDASDAGDGTDAGDAGDAGPAIECTAALDCGPEGVGRCSEMGTCDPCPPRLLDAVNFPDDAAGFGTELAIEAYPIIDLPYCWVVTRDNGPEGRLWNRQVRLDRHMDTSFWDENGDADFTTHPMGGSDIQSPLNFALMRHATQETIWIAATVNITGETLPTVISGQMFAGWQYRFQPTTYADGPGAMTRQSDGVEPRYTWSSSLGSGSELASLRTNDLVGRTTGTPSPLLPERTMDQNAWVDGSEGIWMVASAGTDLHFWRPQVAGVATHVARTDGSGDTQIALEEAPRADSYLVAYGDGPRIRLRRLTCTDSCGWDPASTPAELTLERPNDVSFVRVSALPGGGAALAWVEVTDVPRVHAIVVPDRLDATGAAAQVVATVPAGVGGRVVRALEIDSIEHLGTVYVPMAVLAGMEGAGGTDYATFFGLRFRRDACPTP